MIFRYLLETGISGVSRDLTQKHLLTNMAVVT